MLKFPEHMLPDAICSHALRKTTCCHAISSIFRESTEIRPPSHSDTNFGL